MQTPEIEDQRRCDTEIDEVGEAVELGAKARGALEEPGQAAVDAVEDRREDDGRERQRITVLERHADRGQAGAKREQGDDVRRQRAHRDAAEPPPPRIAETGRLHGHQIPRWRDYSRFRPRLPRAAFASLTRSQVRRNVWPGAVILRSGG